jgi:hypothetical protein
MKLQEENQKMQIRINQIEFLSNDKLLNESEHSAFAVNNAGGEITPE